MGFTKPIGYLCYDNSELARDGYIDSVVAFEHDADDFNFNKLKRNKKGVTYQLIRDDPANPEKITKVIERKKLLPAEKLKIEIQFSKTLKNAVTNPIPPGSIPGSAGFFIGNMFTATGFGGITSGYTDFVYDIIDSEMVINERIKITEDILDTGTIEFDSYPVSIFGIVPEYQEELLDSIKEEEFKEAHPYGRIETDPISGIRIGKVGLDFQTFPGSGQNGEPDAQVDRIGQHSRGSYQGGPRKRIDGATDKKGQFGEVGNPYLHIVANEGDSGEKREQEVILLDGQSNIFLEIVRDFRKLKFRGDNKDASGLRNYPFKNREVDDITDQKISINTSGLKEDDYIYITYLKATKRRVRQAMRHKGVVGQGNRFGVSGWNLEIDSQMDVFDYQIRKWIVPAEVPDSEDSPDNAFKITFQQYKDWKKKEFEIDELISKAPNSTEADRLRKQKQEYFDARFDELEGWRQSSTITSRLDVIWAADYRGIVLMGDKRPATVVFPVSRIRDKEWFLDYVKGLDFIEKHIDEVTGETIYDNLEVKIDDVYSKLNDMAEAPVDIGNPTNELLFDREKIPYYRDFAKALQNVSFFNETEIETGVGIPCLDIWLKKLIDEGAIPGVNSDYFYREEKESYLNSISSAFLSSDWTDDDLQHADLSFSTFRWSDKQPLTSYDCSEDFQIKEHHYSCHTYDAGGDSGVWLTKSYIENQVFEWRPPGGFIESYWKMDTPYFCGEFGRKSRVYIERVGGNSLDNYSWVYVDTWPDVPETVSMDKNIFTGDSYLSYYDNDYLDSASYHVFADNAVESSFRFLDVNTDKNPSRTFLDDEGDESKMIGIADAQRIIGYNNMLGDAPSYSKGRILTNDVSYACKENKTDFWTKVDFLSGTNDSGQSFDLSFSDNIPSIKNIPNYWGLKEIQIDYTVPVGEDISNDEAYATIYFEDEDVAINNFLLAPSHGLEQFRGQEFKLNLDCQYYNSGTIKLLGESWKKLNISSFKGVFADSFSVDEVKVKDGQTSILSDGLGRLFVFFADSLSGNISVAVSYNEGRKWVIYRDILRLLSDEIVTLPVAYQDEPSSTIHLFYVLNDTFLMYTNIDADLFDCKDTWVSYEPPDFYDETSSDDDDSLVESSLHPYSENGKLLRRATSYFVAGSSEENYFLDQINITESIKANNEQNNLNQNIRFDYTGDLADLDDAYNGKPFGINRDNKGILRVFYAGENGLTIKKSNDYKRWEYVAKNIPIHKTYLTDDIKEEEGVVVSNIQVARNYYDEELIYLFYFFRGMLLMRAIPSNVLTVQIDENGDRDDTLLRNFLSIEEGFYGYRPIFISGQIPDDILNVRVKELEEEQSTGQEVESVISIYFPYGLSDIQKFNVQFELDTSTQVFAYTMNNGAVRVFYKDAFGNLNAAYISGNNTTPEIFYEVNQELIK